MKGLKEHRSAKFYRHNTFIKIVNWVRLLSIICKILPRLYKCCLYTLDTAA